MLRIAIVGPSGSGKTTLGRWLGQHKGLPFADLDYFFWRPGWTESPIDAFRADVHRITQAERWIVAGNCAKARDLVWPRADTLIWLDLPLPAVMWRATTRALRQWWSAEPICNGNRQTLAHIVNGRDSLLGYTLRTFHARRREWPQALGLPEHASVSVIRLRSAGDVAAWQAAIQAGNTPVDR